MKNRFGSALLALGLLPVPAAAWCAGSGEAYPLPELRVPQPVDKILRYPVPVTARCISSPFGWRHRVGPMAPAGFHNGIDLPVPAGALVRVPAAGRVVRIRRMGSGGLQVRVEHSGGLVTLYAHLGSVVPALAEGTVRLDAGDPIGRVGRTGVTYGTHLFFAVFAGGRAIDPNLLLGLPPC